MSNKKYRPSKGNTRGNQDYDSAGQPDGLQLVSLFNDVPERSDYPDIKEYANEFAKRNLDRLLMLRSRNRFAMLDFVGPEDYEKCCRACYIFDHPDHQGFMFLSPYGFGDGVALYVIEGMDPRGQRPGTHPIGTGDHMFPTDAVVISEGDVVLMATDSTKRSVAKS